MELLFIAWFGYVIWIATRTQEQQQDHLLLLWGLMLIGVLISLGRLLLQ